ncbi:MAG: hypothetical protein HC836_37545 [Richelia sp. RM2_1_2]|nr:hypothetical protein [Richelia sp. SM1_7_0]NJN12407.1 hypothetical protein [Richelia sp. RM1_1_1]NJO63691.1 hypothetical protein [Richelia sp. RM2_1_2]
MNQKKDDDSEQFYSFFSSVKPRQHKSTSTDEWQSHVLPHGAIEELAPNLWHVTGTLPSSVMVPREMVLYKLGDASLLIHSAIALNESEMANLESLGTPKILVVPNRIHRLDAGVYKKRYPKLIVVCPAAAKPYVEQTVAVDGIAEEILPTYGIVCHEPAGIRPQELVYELLLPTGKALVFTDILFNLNKSYLQQHLPTGEFLLQWIGTSAIGSGGFFGITGLGRRFFMTDRNAYQQWLEALADSIPDLQVISVAHGSPIVADCNYRLREAAVRLR